MFDFKNTLVDIISERGENIEKMIKEGVITKEIFYSYKTYQPRLDRLIALANYLQVSVDYLFALDDENKFRPYSTDQSAFCDNLCRLIKRANMSQRQFCLEMGYTKNCLQNYKNGLKPTSRTIVEIAKFFGCSTDELLTLK